MKLQEKAFIENYSNKHEQKPGGNGLYLRKNEFLPGIYLSDFGKRYPTTEEGL